VLDQYPDGDLVRKPDVRSGEPALGDLAAQHLEVLGDPGGQPVAELGVSVEPLKLMVRPRCLKRGPGDLRGAGQRRRGARVEQPRPAPHQRHQKELGHRVQVERQQRAVPVRRLQAGDGTRRGRAPVPSRDRNRELQPVVHHGARADHRRPLVDEPAAGRVPVTLQSRQPDPVAVARHVECVRRADIGDPGTFRGCPDHPGPPGQPAPSRNCQVHLGTSPEYQMAAFGEPDDLARRGTDMRGHKSSLGPPTPRPAPLNSGMVHPAPIRLTPVARRRAPFWGATQSFGGAIPKGRGGQTGAGGPRLGLG
jgi:hypothetical protein